jgi:hypothetical protein
MKITLLALFLALLVYAHAQTSVPYMTRAPSPSAAQSPGASSTPQPQPSVCPKMRQLSDELDAQVYSQEPQGIRAPLAAEQVNWTQVSTYLAPSFQYQDYSYFNSAGNYSDYRTYWEALNPVYERWPLKNATADWYSCDPVNRRLTSQWKQYFGSAADPTANATSTSLYVTEYDPDYKITRQAYWTSGDIVDLLSTASNTPTP